MTDSRNAGTAPLGDDGLVPLGDDGLTYGLGPEWVPGADGIPFRRGARCLLLDDADRLLLVRGHDAGEVTRSWWFTVGGGLAPGEDPRVGAAREVREETGIDLDAARLVGPVLTRSAVFDFARVTCRQDEQFFLARVPAGAVISTDSWSRLERDVLDELRWWDLDELAQAVAEGVTVYPGPLVEIVRGLLDGWDGTAVHLDEASA